MSTSATLSSRRKLSEESFRAANERLRKEVPRIERKQLKDIKIAVVDNIEDVEVKAAQLQSDLQSITQVRKESLQNRTRYEKVTDTAGQWFRATYPFFELILSVAKDGGSVLTLPLKKLNEKLIDPYGLLISALLKLATMAKEVSEQAAAIDEILDFINKELGDVQVRQGFITNVAPDQLENARCAALDLSAAICNFLAVAIHELGRGPIRRYVATIFKGNSRLKELQHKVTAAKDVYRVTLTVFTLKVVGPTCVEVKKIGTNVREFPAVVDSKFAGYAREEKRTECTAWLHESIPAVKTELHTNLQYQKKTPPSWIFNHPKFNAWLEATNRVNILWLSGPTGFGKSVLAAYLTQALTEKYPDSGVGYFFCKADTRLQEVHQIVRCFLHQITTNCPEARNIITKAWNESESLRDRTAPISELFDALFLPTLRSLRATTSEIFFVIDGMNECPETEIKEMLEFVIQLNSIVTTDDLSLPRIRLVVTSQSTPDISHAIGAFSTVVLQSVDNEDGVRLYVNEKLDTNSDLQVGFEKADVSDPVEFFVDRYNGMFIWVRLMLECLEKYETDDFENLLKSCSPDDLNQVYWQLLDRIKKDLDKHEIEWVKEVIAWTTIATRSLSVTELQHTTMWTRATRRNTDEDSKTNLPELERTLDICGAFLDIGGTDVSRGEAQVRIVHETFAKFITDVKVAHPSFYVNPGTMNAYITMACLSYLSTQILVLPNSEKEILETRFDWQFPLYSYANTEWFAHLSGSIAVHEKELIDRLTTAINHFLNRDTLSNWIGSIVAYYFTVGDIGGPLARVCSTIDAVASWAASKGLRVVADDGLFNLAADQQSGSKSETRAQLIDWLSRVSVQVWLMGNPIHLRCAQMAFQITKRLDYERTTPTEDAGTSFGVILSLLQLGGVNLTSEWSAALNANIGHACAMLGEQNRDHDCMRHAENFYRRSLLGLVGNGELPVQLIIFYRRTQLKLIRAGARFAIDFIDSVIGIEVDFLEQNDKAEVIMLKSQMYTAKGHVTREPAHFKSASDAAGLAHGLISDTDPDMAFFVLELVDALLRQFLWFGAIDDVERTINVIKRALERAMDTPKKELYLSFAVALLYRYWAIGSANALKESIFYCEKSIQEDVEDEGFPYATGFLIITLVERFRLHGSQSDLDKAIELSRVLPNYLPDLFCEALMHSFLTELLVYRALENGSMEDLKEAECCPNWGNEFSKPNHFAIYLNHHKSATLNHAAYEFYGTLERLSQSIAGLEAASMDLPGGTQLWCRLRWIHEYCILLCERFDHADQISDLNYAIEVMENLPDELMEADPELATYKLNLSSAYRRRYIAVEDPEDLSKAIKISQEALEENKKEWKSSDFYAEVGLIILSKYEMSQEKNLHDLDEAIEHLHTAAQHAKEHRGNPWRARRYHDLSLALRLRFEKTGLIEDIDKSIEWAIEANETLPRPHVKDALIKYNLGKSRYSRFGISRSKEELNLAATALRTAINLTPPDGAKWSEYSSFLNSVMEHARELEMALETESPKVDVEEPVFNQGAFSGASVIEPVSNEDLDANQIRNLEEGIQEEWGFAEEWKDMAVATRKFLSEWMIPSMAVVAVTAILYRVGTMRNR